MCELCIKKKKIRRALLIDFYFLYKFSLKTAEHFYPLKYGLRLIADLSIDRVLTKFSITYTEK